MSKTGIRGYQIKISEKPSNEAVSKDTVPLIFKEEECQEQP